MTIWLIANPKAGAGQRGAGFWKESLARAGISDFRVCDFDHDDWLDQVVPGDNLLVAGGDGSVNRAARLCLEKQAILGVLPSGTANDFARNLGIPLDPDKACQLVARGPVTQVDVAFANDNLFLNVCHVGMGTWPVREASSATKQTFGALSYLMTLLRRFKSHRGFHAEIECDSGSMGGRWISIAIATGAFYGGGNPVPEASINDGQLDIVAVRPRSALRLLGAFLLFRFPRHAPRRPSAVVQIKSRHCAVKTRHQKTVTGDGEIMTRTPLEVRCHPDRLSVIAERIVET
ncbi:YegS/Rv2252/BmrU family lipid kinase [Marinobacteraceae bacterium S3BR75-40.1]